MHGVDMFSSEETQVRRQIWWACVMADRCVPSSCFFSIAHARLNQDMVQCILVSGTTLFSGMLMLLSGRPVMIKDEDFETPLPNVDPVRYQQDMFQSVLPSHDYF
jgi:hypothetical protein